MSRCIVVVRGGFERSLRIRRHAMRQPPRHPETAPTVAPDHQRPVRPRRNKRAVPVIRAVPNRQRVGKGTRQFTVRVVPCGDWRVRDKSNYVRVGDIIIPIDATSHAAHVRVRTRHTKRFIRHAHKNHTSLPRGWD